MKLDYPCIDEAAEVHLEWHSITLSKTVGRALLITMQPRFIRMHASSGVRACTEARSMCNFC